MRDDAVTAADGPLQLPAQADRSRAAVVRAFDRLSTDTLAVLDVFLALGLLGVYLKLALMAPQWGAVARFFGHAPGQPLRLSEQVGFFAGDITLNLIAVPILATAMLSLLSGPVRVLVAGLVAALVSLAYFVELRAGTEVGQYISGDVVRDFIGFGLANPSTGLDYLTPASLGKLGGLLLLLAGIVFVARAARRAAPVRRRGYQLALAAPAALLLPLAAVTAAAAYAVRLPHSPLNTSAVGLAIDALVTRPDPASAAAWVSLDDALASLHRLTHDAPADPAHAFVGREADADLLLFMMETGPAQALDFATRASELPAARRLQPKAFVASRHYTAHPYSSDALFAALSGTYPHGRTQLLRDLGPRELNGLFSSMPAEVGHRGVYLPSLYQIELDDSMYRAFGARTLYVADRHPDDPLRAVAERRADALVRRFEAAGPLEPATRRRLQATLHHDLQALERAKADITRAIAGGGRYAVMFFPEIGHGPWLQLRPADTDVLARGRLLMELQDEWLGELLDLVEGAGRLDRTVVAVTADHGLRTRAEYPPLRVGFIADVMFRVPLLIHAPRTLSGPVRIDAPTSHVDLAPTLLALMGNAGAAARMHGVPIWQRTLRDRIYVLGAAYGGADGFVEGGRYYMRQALSGAVYASPTFDFADRHQLAPTDPRAAFVATAIEQGRERQHALVARLRDP
jgi:hypothetical protein